MSNTYAMESSDQPSQQQQPQQKLIDVEITNENIALNVIISFVCLAQKRGVYSLEESAKIWECIKKFQRP
jgi:hypothetical protein